MRLRLRDDGYEFKKIMSGKKWIGRVSPHKDGKRWIGTIGQITVQKPTELEAFQEVAALFMGYESAADLKARNSKVRSQRRTASKTAKHIFREIVKGNFRPLDELFRRG